jgi:predicted Zn finger-like uncharacterized protein
MKISCQSCQAKYTIADEKVLGKVVKIRCKKCSATIVINGNEPRPSEDNADTHVFDYAAGNNAEQWTVNVADGDQRTMTPQEIAAEYKNGVVNDETFCWKDGMADWLPLREIEQLYAAVKLGRPSLHDDPGAVMPASAPPPAAAPLFSANEVASAVDSPFAAAAHSNGNGNGSGAALFGNGAGVEAHAAQPAAARRGGGRGQGADLFGNVNVAGGEDDVMTSAAGAGLAASAGTEDQKLTGQRNESSVLFSLSALTSNAKEPAKTENRTTASADGSGLIDIRALSQTMGSDGEKKDTHARVDDIMNLSGGGAFGAALAAPILAPPPLEAAGPDLSNLDSGKSNKTMLFAILGGAAFIAIAIVVAVVLVTRQPPKDDTASTAPTTTATTATPTASVAAADTSTATPTATSDNTPPPPGTGQASGKAAAPAGGGAKTGGGGGAVAANAHAGGGGGGGGGAAAAPADPKPAEPPKDFAGALAAAAGKPKEDPKPATGGGSTAPFDRGAASAALGGVNVQSCKKPDGPTGSGHVKVTFSPDGSVSSAVVDGGPFPGTPVGGCIAGKYRGARVPAFAGGPVSVGKSFTVN